MALAPTSSRGGGAGTVTSVFTRTGDVVAASNDYTDAQVQNSPTNVLTASGDLLYASAANVLARLAISSNNRALIIAASLPTWGVVVLTTTAADGSVIVGGTASARTVQTGTFDVVASTRLAAGSVTFNSQKATNVAGGVSQNEALVVGARGDFSPGNPAAISGATDKMLGLGSTVTLTPVTSGRVLVIFTGVGIQASSAGNGTIKGWYGTGSAPANNAATTGTQFGPTGGRTYGVNNISNKFLIGVHAVITGLTLNTAYWFDLSAAASAGTADVNDVSATLIEL